MPFASPDLHGVMFEQQPDAVLTQVNPVSATLYEALPATENVRLIGVSTRITWALTQPDPIEIVATIDGVTFVFYQANPVTAVPYYAYSDSGYAPGAGGCTNNVALVDQGRAFLLEGRSVRVQARVTWAVNQPSPLVCRVRWARIP